jgi:hypothetical protein
MSGEMSDPAEPPPPLRLSWRRVLIGAAVLGLGIVGILAFGRLDIPYGAHIIECGVDANGPYAKVRVNSVGGGLGSTDHTAVNVHFTYDGAWYDGQGTRVKLPVLGSTTTVVRGTYPPRVIDLHWDGGPKGKITVEGHTVYRRAVVKRLLDRRPGSLRPDPPEKPAAQQLHHMLPRDPLIDEGPGHQAVRSEHRRIIAWEEIVPDDLQKLGCTASVPEPHSQ